MKRQNPKYCNNVFDLLYLMKLFVNVLLTSMFSTWNVEQNCKTHWSWIFCEEESHIWMFVWFAVICLSSLPDDYTWVGITLEGWPPLNGIEKYHRGCPPHEIWSANLLSGFPEPYPSFLLINVSGGWDNKKGWPCFLCLPQVRNSRSLWKGDSLGVD